ncbi:MAG: DUF4214 domain-containing protein [Burkholderiales bacterium]|nr:DUF4214 domain-containing protein [Burkholderiales bacterium]MDR4518350.1 DUF4214 domain-containing protein [Nitrosomonas sp.]
MGINLEIFDAFHEYGLDNSNNDAVSEQTNQTLLGDISDIRSSWTGSLLPGQSGEFTIDYSKGFTVKQHVRNVGGTSGQITEQSIYHTATNTLLQRITGEILVTSTIESANLDQEVIFAGNDKIMGNTHNNILRGFGGDDVIDGNEGVDTVLFSGFLEDYKITTVLKPGSFIVAGPDGIDTLKNVERIQFEDKKIAFDLTGNAGTVAKIVGAVFGKNAVLSEVTIGNFLALLDSGFSDEALADLALEIMRGEDATDADVIRLLYQNLTGNEPTFDELSFWLNKVESGAFTKTALILLAARSTFNQQNIDISGLKKTGLEYSITDNTIALSGNNAIDSLLGTYKWNVGVGSGANISYSFRTDLSSYSTDVDKGYGPVDGSGEPWHSGWKPLTPFQINGFRNTLQAWSEVANIRLSEVTDNETVSGDIRFSTLPGINESISYQPDSSIRGGDVWLPISIQLLSPVKGNWTYTTFLRETGHALGLDHPHEGRIIADASIDALPYSVMSLRDFVGDSLNSQRDILYPTTPMINDIAALQYVYGANWNTRSDDTVYQWEVDLPVFETIWDGGGIDTIDWSNQVTDALIDLNSGNWSFLGPERWDGHVFTNQNLAIAYNTVIENINGGQGNDILMGNAVDNELNGGEGNDELYGGDGDDRFDWNALYRTGNDTMYGGPGDDIYVIDSPQDQVIELPDEGNDLIWAPASYSLENIDHVERINLFGDGPANATGNALSNTLQGNDYDNILDGGQGNDFLIGKGGNDQLIGGDGLDTSIYLDSMKNFFIDTADQTWLIENGETGEIDSLTGIERIKFIDKGIAYDLDGNAGQIVKTIGVLLGEAGIARKNIIGIGLDLLDSGMSYSELMELALNIRLGTGYSNEAEVTLLYKNLLGRAPSDHALARFVGLIDSGEQTQVSLALLAAETEINITAMGVEELALTGLEYGF